MAYTSITVGGNSVNLVTLPASPGARAVDFNYMDAVGEVESPFTGQIQTQQWPGAEKWSGTFTLPKLVASDAANWTAFLLQLRGMAYAFQLGDPLYQTPRGNPQGSPVITAANAMAQQIVISGWNPSTSGLLLPADYIQIGYRLHRVLDNVTSDDSGNSTVNIWPSVREAITSETAVITEGTQGLFRLASNSRKLSFDVTRLTSLSFQFQEFR